NTKRVDQVDEYHGVKVGDPYRWLETDVRNSKEVADWVAAQNEVTFGYLKAIPEREAIKKRITELWNYEKVSAPQRAGPRYFYSRYPEPQPGQKFQGLPLSQKLYYHRLGTPQGEDVLVYHRPEQPTWTIGGSVTDDGRYLIITIGDGTTSRKSRTVYKDLNE